MFGKSQRKLRMDVRVAGVGVLLAVAFLMLVGAAGAQTLTTICVPEASSKPLLSTNTQGECPTQVEKKTEVKYKTVQLPGTGDLETLNKLLPHLKFEEQGVGGKPTIQVTGANLQIVSGSGKTNGPVNGAGNLIIGYADEAECTEILHCHRPPPPHTGSHNLVLGTGQAYTSWGAILGGLGNKASARNAFVVGNSNVVSGIASSISGGYFGIASGIGASISGGGTNVASANRASVSGGNENSAIEPFATVSGGRENTAFFLGSVFGGNGNIASGAGSAILGGFENTAFGEGSSVGGGRENTASGHISSVSGGEANTASGRASALLGGKGVTESEEWGHFP
jgi:hypothetical protein